MSDKLKTLQVGPGFHARLEKIIDQWTYSKAYKKGWMKSRFPLPAVHGSADIYPECVTICDADEWSGDEPIITWWNEGFAERYGLRMPEDHGIAYWRER